MTEKKARKVLATYGPKGATVRVVELDADTVRAEWYEGPKGAKRRRVKDWANTGAGRAEAKGWAKGFSTARTVPGTPTIPTLRSVWEDFTLTEFEHLRDRTKRLYAEHWRFWERMWGRGFEIGLTTPKMMAEFRAAMTKRGISTYYLGKIITTIKQVYRFARLNGHIPVNPVGDYRYKVAKDKRRKPVPEYSQEEFDAIMATFDPKDGRTWRAFVGLSLCGWQGIRENAAVHLQWADIDWDENVITWRARYDKMGKEWTQPMRSQTRVALAVAKYHRERLGYTGPWVLFAGNSLTKRDGTYSPVALIKCLRTAEKRAGVKYMRNRGPHGLRRLLAGNVAAATGNAVLAMRSIGDSDVRMANRYILERDEEIRAAFEAVDRRTAAEGSDAHRHSTASDPENEAGASVGRPSETVATIEDTNASD